MDKKHLDGNAHLQIRSTQISLAIGSTALIITLLMSGFYIADTTTGNSNLRNVLASLGICKPLDETPATLPTPSETVTESPTPNPTPSESQSTTPTPTDSPAPVLGADGEDGEEGSDGIDGAPGSIGPAGLEGPAAPCSYVLDLALIDGNLVPAIDNYYSLGSSDFRWKGLQLGPGTLYIEDPVTGEQVGITVNDGSLLLDGADSLRIGNIRLTAEGLESIDSNEDIRIGNLGDTGYVLMARGLKFPDGTTQTTASLRGPEGPPGVRGPEGPEGPPGSIGDYREQRVCVENNQGRLVGNLMMGTCDENSKRGTDIVLLMKVP